MTKTAIFIILPDYNTTYYGVASLFVDQIYTKLADVAGLQGGRLKRRVQFYTLMNLVILRLFLTLQPN